MSMLGWVLGLSPPQIAAVRATPSLAVDLAWLTQTEQLQAGLAAALSRLPADKRAELEARFRSSPVAREADARTADARARVARLGQIEQALCLEKSWHILHYVFTGHVDDASAPGDALLTGEPLGDDLGYGPARVHDEKETQAFAGFLAALDAARLEQRVNYQDMARAGVYSVPIGQGSDAQREGELRAEVATYFPRLRDYVGRMAARHNGLLIWLS